MEECEFCGEEVGDEEDLHRHWEEHEEELNSHQRDEMKAAKRKYEERQQEKMQERKTYAVYGLGAVILLGFAGFAGSQLLMGGSASQTAQRIDLEGEPYIGNASSNVTVVEFGDYRCPFCGRFHSNVYRRLKQEYIETGKIKFYFINYAFLDSGYPGQTSNRAAVAAECVYNQDRKQFWNFHGALYESQGRESTDWATEEFLLETFNDSTSGLDYGKFRSCLQNRKTQSEVNSDRRKAGSAGVSSTPSLFVNGEPVENWQYEGLSAKIEEEIKEQKNR
ncbi:MAG: DsbA family protein [Candidatus Nanohaloarchaea archaeon]